MNTKRNTKRRTGLFLGLTGTLITVLVLAVTRGPARGAAQEAAAGQAAAAQGAAAQAAAAAGGGYDWPQFGFDARHSGSDTRETAINAGNVGRLQRLYQVGLPDTADGAPAYLRGVRTGGGVRDLLFVTTKSGFLVAVDAQSGQQVWAVQHGPGACHINGGGSACYTTSSPALDPNRKFVYSYGLDGYVHKHRVGDGSEVTGGGWPELATTKPSSEKGSSALSIAAGYLYVTNGGYFGDQGDYQGHITAINLASGGQRVFNLACSNQATHFVMQPGAPDCPSVQSAVWGRAGVVYDSDTGRIYAASGNGDTNPAAHDWGDSVIALTPAGTGAGGNPLDAFTPANYRQLSDSDADLGSAAPAILPAPANSRIPHLAVQAGKDGLLRLLNLDNLSQQGGPGHIGGEVVAPVGVPQGGEVLTAPAVWTNPADGSVWVFVTNGQGASGLRLVVGGDGLPSLQPVWQIGGGGASPVVAGNVLFFAGSGSIRALDPASGRQLWQDGSSGGIHWESPIVANGRLYITNESGQLTAYGVR